MWVFKLILFSSLAVIQDYQDVEDKNRLQIYSSVRTENPPSIDGELSDAPWQNAHIIGGMTQRFPDPGKPASFVTQIRVMHDDEALYIAAHCQDPQPEQIIARVTRRDRWIESDWFQVELDSRRDLRSGYFFAVNAAGVRYDGTLFNENQEDSSWDGVWSAETKVVDDGWIVEMRIPLRLLRFHTSEETRFGINFIRRISRLNESDQWQYTPPETGLRVSRFGELRNLDMTRKPGQFELSPYMASRIEVESGNFINDSRYIDLGVDGKIGLGSNFMLTMTANPDFGQVEADQVVLNLSTVETYFPEKRSFFLEDASLFQMPRFGDGGPRAELFYTRRIGQTGRQPDLEGDEELEKEASVPRIYGAAKLAGATEGRLSVGLVQAITSAENAQVKSADGLVSSRLAEPLTSYSVIRLEQGFANNSTAGMMVTAVNTSDHGSALTGGTNLQLEFLDGRYNAMLLTQVSYLTEERFVYHDDFTRRALENKSPFGFGSQLVLQKKSGEHLVGAVGGTYRSPSLALNDVGYLDRPDLFMPWVWLQLRHLKPVGPIAQAYLNANVWLYRNNDLVNIGDGLGLNAFLKFKNNMFAGVNYNLSGSRCDDRETRTAGRVVVCGLAERHLVNFFAYSDPGKLVSAGIELAYYNTDLGNTYSISVPLSMNPASRVQLELIPRYENSKGKLRWIDTEEIGEGERFLFANQHSEFWDLTFRSTLTITKDFTLQSYTQVFLASVDHADKYEYLLNRGDRVWLDKLDPVDNLDDDYDSTSASVNLGVVLRWEYLPGSVGYLVYTSNLGLDQSTSDFRFGQTVNNLFSLPSRNTFMLKLSYLWS